MSALESTPFGRINGVLEGWGLPSCSNETLERFAEFARLLREKNKSVNLTSVDDDEGIAVRHILDSLALFRAGNIGGRALDLGCGGGVPGLPAAIYASDRHNAFRFEALYMLDSTAKKLAFVDEAARALGLAEVVCLCGRAEELAADKDLRASFDLVFSRAVARMNLLSELSLPYVKLGGRFIAMKSKKSEAELDEAAAGIALLGGKQDARVDYALALPGGEEMRSLLAVVTKISQTPPKYPRKYAQIAKNPL